MPGAKDWNATSFNGREGVFRALRGNRWLTMTVQGLAQKYSHAGLADRPRTSPGGIANGVPGTPGPLFPWYTPLVFDIG